LRDPGEFVVFVKPRVSQENTSADETPAVYQSTAPSSSSVPNPIKWWRYFFN
jgi:hypothetical protein